jgi:hypothetical protein
MNKFIFREKSIAFLAKKQMYIPTYLPLLDDSSLKNVSDIKKRALTLNAVVATSFGLQRKKAIDWLVNEGLYDSLTLLEKKYLLSDKDDNNKNFQVKIHCLFVFSWVLKKYANFNIIDDLPNDLIKKYPDLIASQSSKKINLKLRDELELLQQCDTAYCLDWCFTQEKLINNSFDSSSIINHTTLKERRRVLEWCLYDDNDWDDISFDT